MMKKFTAIFLTVLMLMLNILGVVYAEGTTISMEDKVVYLDESREVTIPIIISSNTGFANFDFSVEYDENEFTPVSVVKDTINVAEEFSPENGVFLATWERLENEIGIGYFTMENILGDGPIAYITLSVNDNVKEGDYYITITTAEVYDLDGAKLFEPIIEKEVVAQAKITVKNTSETPEPTPEPVMIGDVTLDGEINPDDAVAILRHCAKIITLTEEERKAAETVKDGEINPDDAVAILRYCAKLITSFE